MSQQASMSSARERGNQLYVAGNYAAAAAAYSEGLKNERGKTDERAALLCNRSACYLELRDLGPAEADCRACLQLQPCNVKAHYRLARALPQDHPDAVSAIASAIAFCDPSSRSDAMLQCYTSIRNAAVAAAAEAAAPTAINCISASGSGDDSALQPPLLLQLPPDPVCIADASSWTDVKAALRHGASFIVLRPGTYTTATVAPAAMPGVAAYTLLAVGTVVLKAAPGGSHAFWVDSDQSGILSFLMGPPPVVTLAGVKLVGSGSAAAACVSGDGTRLNLLACHVEDYREAGLLVAGQCTAQLARCTFTRTAVQAIEVREGGKLVADRVTIISCGQGVSVYGGARSVVLRDCTILNSKKENVMVSGMYENAATEAQGEDIPHRGADTIGRTVSLAAMEWGRQHGTLLDVMLLGCTIGRAGCFGVSADRGANVVARGCDLEFNDPVAFLIKGGTDVSILACRIVYSGSRSDCTWGGAKHGSGGRSVGRGGRGGRCHGGTSNALWRQSGIHVGVNYGGNVAVIGNAFCGPEELAVVDELKNLKADCHVDLVAQMRSRQMWSKPISEDRNSYHDKKMRPARCSGGGGRGGLTEEVLPSLESLAQRLPAWAARGFDGGGTGGLRSRKVAGAAPPPPALLQRTCYTFPQAGWAPTSHQYYVMGNTFGYDVTGGAADLSSYGTSTAAAAATAVTAATPIRILLAACGDFRNLLATTYAARGSRGGGAAARAADAAAADADAAASTSNSAASRFRRLEFTMNDGNLAMLARNVVMLHMASELNAPASAVLAVWACHGLTAPDAELLSRSIRALATDPWPSWLTASTRLDPTPAAPEGKVAEAVEAEALLRDAFASWASCTLKLSDLLNMRQQLLGGRRGAAGEIIRLDAVKLSMGALKAQVGEVAAEALRQEVQEYIYTGSLRPDHSGGSTAATKPVPEPLVAANPTLLLAPQLQYAVYFSSSIFRALPLGAERGTATARLTAALRPQLDAVARGLHDGDISVQLVPGDILAAMLAEAPAPSPAQQPKPASDIADNQEAAEVAAPASAAASPPLYYDFIDCSNVADYVSLQGLLQSAAPLLAHDAHVRLRAESLVLYSKHVQKDPALTVAGFVSAQIRPSLPAFQELLGLQLMEAETEVWPARGVRTVWAIQTDQRSSVTANDFDFSSNVNASFADGRAQGMSADCGRDTRAVRKSWLTAPRLVLELLPACKALLFPEGLGSAGTAPTAAPLALVHLLKLALTPPAVEPLVRALVRCDSTGAAALFKWELTLHAQLQAADDSGWLPQVRRLSYAARPGWNLVGCHHQPLLLAFSRVPLPPVSPLTVGGQGGSSSTCRVGFKGPVKQLMAAFAWDEDAATAYLMLPESLLKQCATWFVTLCIVRAEADCCSSGGGGGMYISPVGVSTRLASLRSELAEPVRWRSLGQPDRFDILGMGLIDRIGHDVPDAPKAPQSWNSCVSESDGTAIVDVLAPGPLPEAAEATVTASLEDSKFVVQVKPKQGGSGNITPDEFVVQLPAAGRLSYGKPSDIWLSRKLGLISARVDLITIN
ncbi:hypothetical protein VaNZ11_004810 [Volvox africanus]|uniref:DUF4470 domain-containing protein n=1 Tax=Volvox africanus TaxID=51714 RepID=A0ABQ5RXA8_9CHLO|nr:hypothetical protein VaNZ11_004810 [Volvox africanus]